MLQRIASSILRLFVTTSITAGCAGALEVQQRSEVSPSPVQTPSPLVDAAPYAYDALMTCVEQAPDVAFHLRQLEARGAANGHPRGQALENVFIRTATITSMALPIERTVPSTPLDPAMKLKVQRLVQRCERAAERANTVAREADMGTANVLPATFQRMRNRATTQLRDTASDAAAFMRSHGNTASSERL